MGHQIKVLVVDDSYLFREVITRGISTSPDIEVTAKAADPIDAVNKLLVNDVDVVTCDIEMPHMNGISFIRNMLPQYPIPVIVVSSVSNAVFDAMRAGAVDFISKPDAQAPDDVKRFLLELIAKIKIAARSKVMDKEIDDRRIESVRSLSRSDKRLIAIGSSTGGTEALHHLLKKLPTTVPGIVCVQHIPPVFSRMFADRLNEQTGLSVKEAESGDEVVPGKVFIAPGNRHMRIRKDGHKVKIECFAGDKVNGHIPSADVLFDSVAAEIGHKAIGVILTGMGYDGAAGLLRMRRKGAVTFGQDEASSVVYGMPRAAFNIGAVERQADLAAIPGLIVRALA